MSGCSEGIPRDMEPAGGGEQLVGVVAGAEIVDEALELARVLGANVGGLAKEVLRVADATDEGIDAGRTEAVCQVPGPWHILII